MYVWVRGNVTFEDVLKSPQFIEYEVIQLTDYEMLPTVIVYVAIFDVFAQLLN